MAFGMGNFHVQNRVAAEGTAGGPSMRPGRSDQIIVIGLGAVLAIGVVVLLLI